ncbi:MAG: integrase core domain-containing protein [Lentisphaeraceae bacterium]|nr:integrase core domain-containing protein [Lentisphaeraceae bacterium]
MDRSWKGLVAKYLGIDVDVSILQANDFLVKQIQIVLKIIQKNELVFKFTDEDRRQLAELGAKLNPKKREDYSMLVTGETLLTWHRQLIGKLIQSKKGKRNGAPPITDEERQLIIKMARENEHWGLLRICGEIKKSGYNRCPTTIRNVLKKAGIEPPPLKCNPKGNWQKFMDAHSEVWQTDFAVHPVVNLFDGTLTRYYIQLFINTRSREVVLGGITSHPNEQWMKQSARNLSGFEMESATLIIRDNDKIYQNSFDNIFKEGGCKVAPTCIASPDMNSLIERYIWSIQRECLDLLMLFSKKQLEYAVSEYIQFYNNQRPHQGLDNQIPKAKEPRGGTGRIICDERLGGLLKSYERLAA